MAVWHCLASFSAHFAHRRVPLSVTSLSAASVAVLKQQMPIPARTIARVVFMSETPARNGETRARPVAGHVFLFMESSWQRLANSSTPTVVEDGEMLTAAECPACPEKCPEKEPNHIAPT